MNENVYYITYSIRNDFFSSTQKKLKLNTENVNYYCVH